MEGEFGLSIILKLEEGFKVLGDQLIHVKDSLAATQANETRVLTEQIHQLRQQLWSSQNKLPTDGQREELGDASSMLPLVSKSLAAASSDVPEKEDHHPCKVKPSEQNAALADKADVNQRRTCDLDEEAGGSGMQTEQLSKRPSEAVTVMTGTEGPSRLSSSEHNHSRKYKKKTDWDTDVLEANRQDSLVSWANSNRVIQTEETKEDGMLKHMIYPQSNFRMTWDVLGMTLLVYDLVIIPLSPFEVKSLFFVCMTWITAIYWTFDIGFSFITGYFWAGKLVMIPQKVVRHYLATWFLFDVIIVAPEWVSLSLNPSGKEQSLSKTWALLRVLRIIRFVRLLRLVKVKQLLDELEAMLDSQLVLLTMIVVKLSFGLFFIVHTFACVWYWIGRSDEKLGWVSVDDIHDKPFAIRYITCFQWAMQMFHPSRPRASLHEGTEIERMFELASTMFGLICSSLFISTVTNTMVTLQAVYTRQSFHRRVIHNYVTSHNISPDLAAVAKQQVRLQIDRISRQMADVELTLLVAKPLLMDMREQARFPLMFKNAFFMLLHDRYPRAFRRLCHEAFVEINAFQTEKIFSDGDAADRMFFIEVGSFQYTPLGVIDDEAGKRQLKSGDCLSEAALWVSHWTYHGELEVSSKRSVVLALLTSTFTNVLHHFPEAHADSAIYAEYFVKLLSDVDTADLEFFTPPPAPADEIK